MNGYLIADSINQHLSDTNMHFSPAQIVFTMETSDSSELFTANAANQAAPKTAMGGASIVDSYNVNLTTTNITAGAGNDAVTYLGVSITKYATTITTNTAIFNAAFLTAPAPLPTTSVSNFTFFVNGQLVDVNSITSFIDNEDGTCTLSINTTNLGYTLVSTDQILAIGKFQ